MEAKIVPIGNSRGIRIPKAILEIAGLQDSVVLEVTDRGVLVSPGRGVRDGWDVAAAGLQGDGSPGRSAAVSRPHPKRGDVFRLRSPTRGPQPESEPFAVLSPDELNRHLSSYLMAPLIEASAGAPSFRVACRIGGRDRVVAIDRMEAVEGSRLGDRLGWLSPQSLDAALARLREAFAG